MPYKEKEIEKQYYSISEVAKIFEVNASTIRFWEKEFDVIKPKKNRKGNRMFTVRDMENLKVIYHLVKERGFTLDGARNHMKHHGEQAASEAEVVAKLGKIKAFLLELKEQL